MDSLLSHAGYTTVRECTQCMHAVIQYSEYLSVHDAVCAVSAPAKMANVNFDLGTLVMVVNSPPFLDLSSI